MDITAASAFDRTSVGAVAAHRWVTGGPVGAWSSLARAAADRATGQPMWQPDELGHATSAAELEECQPRGAAHTGRTPGCSVPTRTGAAVLRPPVPGRRWPATAWTPHHAAVSGR